VTGDIEYDRSLSDSLNGFIGGSISHQSQTFSLLGESPLLEIEPYTLFDLRFGIHHPDDKWRIGAFVRNVTNKYYNLLKSPVADTSIAFAGQPRTYGVTASVRY
jgi:outer membrane receptor protein involved in Fe transport